jgi:hypothetical protein
MGHRGGLALWAAAGGVILLLVTLLIKPLSNESALPLAVIRLASHQSETVNRTISTVSRTKQVHDYLSRMLS